MKKILFFFSVLFFAFPLFPAQRSVDFARLEQAVRQTGGQSGLYNLAVAELSAYYGRADFSDPGRQTGWYRVDDFLAWLKNNEKTLLASPLNIDQTTLSLEQLLHSQEPYAMQTVWAFLGIKYLQYKAASPNQEVFSFHYCAGKNCGMARQRCAVYLGVDNTTPALLFNAGLHEATHVLNGCVPGRTLSEAATIRAQNRWALPIHADAGGEPRLGVRDARVLFQARPNPRYFGDEYAFFFLAPLLQDDAFHILHHDSEAISFCRFLSEKLMPEWGPVITGSDGPLEKALGKWLGKRQTAQAFEAARAGKLLTLGAYSREEVLNFYQLYWQANAAKSADTAQEQTYLAEKARELDQPSYWGYLSFDGRFTLLFSQTPALEDVLKHHFPPNAVTPEVIEFFERARDQQNKFDGRCSTMEFMGEINAILNDLAAKDSVSKVPAGYM